MQTDALTTLLEQAGAFQFDLPASKIALDPLADPLTAKLLCCLAGECKDYQVKDLLEVLPEKCLLVFNDTKVRHARLLLDKLPPLDADQALKQRTSTDLFLAEPKPPGNSSDPSSVNLGAATMAEASSKVMSGVISRPISAVQPARPTTRTYDAIVLRLIPPNQATALIQQSKKLKLGDRLKVQGSAQSCQVLAKDLASGEVTLQFDGLTSLQALESFLQEAGLAPLPPYILKQKKQRDPEQDKRRYQSVLAKNLGSLAAPTASFHFTADLIEAIKKSGRKVVTITMHVGRGTFAPLQAENFQSGKLFPETYQIGSEALAAILEAKKNGWPVVAIGTTVLRALESSFLQEPRAGYGTTDLFIRPGFQFRCVDLLLTNFHLSASSLLLLVQAFAGDCIQQAYQHALAHDYRFYSFGDCMLVEQQKLRNLP